MRKWAILAICLGVWVSLGARPAPGAHRYALSKVWATRLGPSELARLAVCADGRSYVITESRRLVVLDRVGQILDDVGGVPGLQHALAAGCGPGDLLYAGGNYFTVLRWDGRGKVSLVASATLPLLFVTSMAVATNGEALVGGEPRPGMANLYLVQEDGSYLARVGRVKERLPEWKRSLEAFRYSLAFDSRGRRFLDAPWDRYELRTFSLRGKPLGTFARKDPNFEPGALPAGPGTAPQPGDEVQGVVALPDGHIVTAVLKQHGGAHVVYTDGAYLEVLNRAFRPLGRISLVGTRFGQPRGADRAGNLYFLYNSVPGGLAVVKARLALH